MYKRQVVKRSGNKDTILVLQWKISRDIGQICQQVFLCDHGSFWRSGGAGGAHNQRYIGQILLFRNCGTNGFHPLIGEEMGELSAIHEFLHMLFSIPPGKRNGGFSSIQTSQQSDGGAKLRTAENPIFGLGKAARCV